MVCVLYYVGDFQFCVMLFFYFFFFKQKTAYEMRISDWSSDVCSSDLIWTARRRILMRGWVQEEPAEVDVVSIAAATLDGAEAKIGRASCRERVCQYV